MTKMMANSSTKEGEAAPPKKKRKRIERDPGAGKETRKKEKENRANPPPLGIEEGRKARGRIAGREGGDPRETK